MQLRLLEWETEGVPVLKVLTDEAFAGMTRSIDESEGLTAGQKGQRKGMLCTMNTPVAMNGQGKVLIPRKLADELGLEAGGVAHLYGRGTNFDIVSPRDHAAMDDAHRKLKKDLYGSVDFS